MLTDRGRQYTNWRGTTRFERELGKDRVKHIKSQAHHPMTLGKIERFWKTIYEEFLVRAQFGSFEEARERIRHWVQYYNHKRPHQGIGGLCPADRYFEIQAELKKTMEQGIADNVLEMALRGKPKEPFYMVGRMEGQSVVLRAEKGKLRLMVDDEEGGGKQEMVYDVTAGEEKRDRSIETIEREETDGKDREAEGGEAGDRGEERAEGIRPYGRGEVPGGALGMDGETQTRGGMPGVGSCVEFIEPVAGAGDGGDALGLAATGSGDGEDSGIELASCGIVGAEEQERRDERIGAAFGPTPGESGQARGTAGNCTREEGLTIFREIGNGGKGGRHKKEKEQKLARERALVILQVRSGALTAKEGAKLLGVSRKTYYEWEEKSLKAMALALENHPAGRPPVPVDPEKETLRERIQELEKKLDLAEKTIEVKELLGAYEEFRDKGSKKNRSIDKKR